MLKAIKQIELGGAAAARNRGVRGTILTTEMDPRVGDQRDMVSVMEREGLPHEFIVAPNTGHWYPADLAERIDQALRHITGNPFVKHEIAGAWAHLPYDLDGDGDMDVLAGGTYSHQVVWYENRSARPIPPLSDPR